MRFEPLSFEAQGAFGSGVRRMLKYAEKAFAKEEETLNGTASNTTDEDGFTKKTWLAPTEYQYRLQRMVVALARWNSRMMVAGLTALDGRVMPKIALLSTVDTSDTTLNTARWWPVENDMGERGGVEVVETSSA